MAEGQSQTEQTNTPPPSPQQENPEAIRAPAGQESVDLPSDDPKELNNQTQNTAAKLTKHSNNSLTTLEDLIKKPE